MLDEPVAERTGAVGAVVERSRLVIRLAPQGKKIGKVKGKGKEEARVCSPKYSDTTLQGISKVKSQVESCLSTAVG